MKKILFFRTTLFRRNVIKVFFANKKFSKYNFTLHFVFETPKQFYFCNCIYNSFFILAIQQCMPCACTCINHSLNLIVLCQSTLFFVGWPFSAKLICFNINDRQPGKREPPCGARVKEKNRKVTKDRYIQFCSPNEQKHCAQHPDLIESETERYVFTFDRFEGTYWPTKYFFSMLSNCQNDSEWFVSIYNWKIYIYHIYWLLRRIFIQYVHIIRENRMRWQWIKVTYSTFFRFDIINSANGPVFQCTYQLPQGVKTVIVTHFFVDSMTCETLLNRQNINIKRMNRTNII